MCECSYIDVCIYVCKSVCIYVYVQEYAVPCHARYAYENEILLWQQNGWLLLYSEEELGPPKGLIPLTAVMQKLKERPVLDYQELNSFVDAFTINAEVCVQKLREWR